MTDKKHHWLARLPGQLSLAFANAAALALITAVTAAPHARAQAVPLSVTVQKNASAAAPVETARAETAATVRAADETVQLGRYVVSASRTAQDPRHTPSAVTLVSIEDLDLAQVPDMRAALAATPGVNISNTGPVGGPSSVFIRGANNDHTLFVVDGVRMNDRAASYNNYLGGADLGGIGRMEILRGPQSTLYGSSAIGGVIVMDTPRGCGVPAGFIAAGAGAFDTWHAAAAISGGTQVLGYSASINRYSTANDLPANDYDHWGYSARLEYAPRADNMLLFGATFRADNDEYQQTGSRTYYSPGEVNTDNYLGTLYAQLRLNNTFTSRLTAAYHERHYDWQPVMLTGFETSSSQYNKRHVIDWQNTLEIAPRVELVGGFNYEHSDFVNDGESKTDDITAGYLSASARPVDALTLTAGLRYDHFRSVGGATTWRAAAAWLPAKDTKIHASYGTGFNAPSPSDIAGVPAWGTLANPDLSPEKSRGWDIGIEQRFLNERIIADVTYFENRFRDLIAWQALSSTTSIYENVSHATTRGVEASAIARITDTIQVRASYTHTQAKNTDTDKRLARRPRHVVDGEIRWQPVRDLTLGAGVHGVSDRVNSEGGPRMEDFTTARVFASYTLRPANLTFKLRAENALNEKYEDVLGYPALPFGLFGGIEWRF